MNKQITGINQERDLFKKENKALWYATAYKASLSRSKDNPFTFMGFYLPLIAFAGFFIWLLLDEIHGEASVTITIVRLILDIVLSNVWVVFYPYLKAHIYAKRYSNKKTKKS